MTRYRILPRVSLALGGRTYSNSTRLYGNDRAGGELLPVAIEDVDAHRTLLARGQSHEADQTRMRSAKGYGELAEILVERHQDAALFMGESENLLVTGVAVPVSGPLRIVAGVGKLLLGLPPYAGIEQNLHEPVWRSSGSMRSCPTTRFA